MSTHLRRKVVSGLFWSLTQAWFNQGMVLVVFVLLARLLAPEDFGAVAIATVLIGVLTLFVQQGFATSIIQRKDLEPGHLNAAFWMNLLSGLIFASVAVTLAGPVAAFYGLPELVWVIRLLALNLIIGALAQVQSALLSKHFKFKALAIRTLIATAVGGAVGLILAYRGYGVYSLVGQQIVTNAVALAVLWAATTWIPGVRMSGRHIRDLWGFGSHVFGASLLNMVRKRSDVLVVSIFFGPVVTGFYTVAMKPIFMVVTMFTKVVSKVALPAFSTLQDSPERLAHALSLALKIVAIFFLPVVLLLVLHGDLVIIRLFGEAWAPSANLVGILAFWGVAQAVLVLFAQAVVAKGRPGLVFGLTGVLAAGCPLLMVAAAPWGVQAVAVINVVFHLLVAFGFFFVVRKTIGVSGRQLLYELRSPLIAASGLTVIAVGLQGVLSADWQLAVGFLVGLSVYGIIILAVERLSPRRILEAVRVGLPARRAVPEPETH
jgi:O-antigen/teichoic acid export membrane protein